MSQQPKIAFIVSGKSPKTHPGGLGAYAYNTAKIFKSLGYDAYIVGFSDEDEVIDLEFAKLIHVKVPLPQLVSLGWFIITPYLARAMERIVDQTTPTPKETIVYGAGLWGYAGNKLRAKLAKRGIKTKTFVGYFSTFDHDSWGQVVGAPVADYGIWSHLFMRLVHYFTVIFYRPFEHRMLQSSDKVVVHYDSTKKILLDEVKSLPEHKIVKTPYYVDLYERQSATTFEEENIIRDKSLPTVSVICRQDPRKGINTFLKAVKILVERGVRFNCLVVGKGVFLKQNIGLAKRLGIESHVQFLGFVKSVDAVLDASDVYVLPSVEEGSGAISLLEAMKVGVAIVTTRCDGIPEDFVHGETGLLVAMEDSSDMANQLESLIKDKALRERLANNVRADYPRRFTFEGMQKGLASVVQAAELS